MLMKIKVRSVNNAFVSPTKLMYVIGYDTARPSVRITGVVPKSKVNFLKAIQTAKEKNKPIVVSLVARKTNINKDIIFMNPGNTEIKNIATK